MKHDNYGYYRDEERYGNDDVDGMRNQRRRSHEKRYDARDDDNEIDGYYGKRYDNYEDDGNAQQSRYDEKICGNHDDEYDDVFGDTRDERSRYTERHYFNHHHNDDGRRSLRSRSTERRDGEIQRSRSAEKRHYENASSRHVGLCGSEPQPLPQEHYRQSRHTVSAFASTTHEIREEPPPAGPFCNYNCNQLLNNEEYNKMLRYNAPLIRERLLPSDVHNDVEGKSCVSRRFDIPKQLKLDRRKKTQSDNNSKSTVTTFVCKGATRGAYEYDSGVNTYVAHFDYSKDSYILQTFENPDKPSVLEDSDEILVRIETSTVSISDCHIRRGSWWCGSLALPRIPGTSFCGRVEQLSSSSNKKKGSSKLNKDDLVISLVASGGNSRYLSLPANRVVKIPEMDTSLAVCLPEIYLSAFQALHFGQGSFSRYRKNALANKKVLVIGGPTPMGRAVLELSREAGAVAYATVREKHFKTIAEVGGIPLCRELNGRIHIMNSIDILIAIDDVNCLEDDLTYDHLNLLNKKGKLIIIGAPERSHLLPNVGPGIGACHSDVAAILRKSINYNVFESWERDIKQGKRDILHLANLIKDKALNPRILEHIPLSKVAKAQALSEMRRLHGVIICEPWLYL